MLCLCYQPFLKDLGFIFPFLHGQLKLCRSLNAEKSKVISALVSVASTYSDIRQHDKAVAYYHQEVELRDDCEHKEVWCTALAAFHCVHLVTSMCTCKLPEDNWTMQCIMILFNSFRGKVL